MTLRKMSITYNARSHPVSWHDQPVYMLGVSPGLYDTETGFNIYCADWLRKEKRVWWHHSANERSGLKAGMLAKRMGQSRGFPDFIHCGDRLAIELKVKSGQLSEHQTQWLAYLALSGWKCAEIRDFSTFKAFVETYEEDRTAEIY